MFLSSLFFFSQNIKIVKTKKKALIERSCHNYEKYFEIEVILVPGYAFSFSGDYVICGQCLNI